MIEMHSNKQKKEEKLFNVCDRSGREGLIEMGFPYRKIKQAQSGLTKKTNHGWWIIGLKRCSVMNLGWSRR